jgi:hypothetical protein
LKGSNDTSVPGRAKADAHRSTSGAKSPPSRPVEWFALAGVSCQPDPLTHAYRKDLADTALAGRVIASHYADPLIRHLATAADFLRDPEDDSDLLAKLQPGDEIRMLDLSRGWAWGYGPDGRVGYVRAEAVAP